MSVVKPMSAVPAMQMDAADREFAGRLQVGKDLDLQPPRSVTAKGRLTDAVDHIQKQYVSRLAAARKETRQCTRVESKNAAQDSDAEFARLLATKEESEQWARLESRYAAEDADAEFARLLAVEEQTHARSMAYDESLATCLQAEHGRSGKLLSRAKQLDDFLEAPLGSRALPQDGDLAPETLRRIVDLSRSRMTRSTGALAPSDPGPGIAADSAIAGAPHLHNQIRSSSGQLSKSSKRGSLAFRTAGSALLTSGSPVSHAGAREKKKQSTGQRKMRGL